MISLANNLTCTQAGVILKQQFYYWWHKQKSISQMVFFFTLKIRFFISIFLLKILTFVFQCHVAWLSTKNSVLSSSGQKC